MDSTRRTGDRTIRVVTTGKGKVGIEPGRATQAILIKTSGQAEEKVCEHEQNASNGIGASQGRIDSRPATDVNKSRNQGSR